jgi:serine/threonine-protein kinase
MIRDLDPARWAVLSPYLDEALDVPEAQRTEWLDALRARDAMLAREVEALLAEYRQIEDEDFLGRPPEPRATLAGQTLGSYTLREQIGQGGMGTVWRADRSDHRYEGQAAVKLLNVSLISNEAEERFRREGSILARLRHPHIAQLIDAGVSPAGQPYLVLEHVDGAHLDDYCDRRRLGVEPRVRLFLDVLAAVSHAHANLIVHRDLKPSNVLVDASGSVKLLDFGVAKLLSTDAADAPSAVTRDGSSALTPEYASPEQLTGGDITTATDVYALGVLLYQLLSGQHPAGSSLRAFPGEMLRAILEREPARLSPASLTDDGAFRTARERAAARGTTPQALSRALRGDLETIAAKALKKDPAERYASVVAFADDLRRHLGHLPIGARPDTFAYRTSRFVRRHRLPVALGAMVVAALAAGLAGTLWQARAVARERDRAIAQLVRADNANEFTAYLLGKAVPNDEPLRVADILKLGEDLAGRRSQVDPTLAVDLLVSIGDTYMVRDDLDGGGRALKRAYDLSQTLDDRATRARAACAWGRSVGMGDKTEDGLRLIGEGLALTSADERFDGAVTACLLARTSIGMRQDSAELVSASAEAALLRLERRPGAFPDLRAEALQMKAMGHRLAGEAAEADRVFAQAFEQLRLLGRADSTDGASLLANWATNAGLTNPLAALDLERRLVAIYGGVDSDAAPVPALHNYAIDLIRVARYAEARAVLERAQTLSRRHGSDLGLVLVSLQLAQACLASGDLACTQESLRLVETAPPASLEPSSQRIRGDVARLRGLLAAAEGRDAQAHGLMLEARSLYQSMKMKSSGQVNILLELARIEMRLGRPQDAEASARDALARAESFRGGATHSSWVGQSLLALGVARKAQGDAAGARAAFAQAVEHMTPTLGPSHPAVIEARQALALASRGNR